MSDPLDKARAALDREWQRAGYIIHSIVGVSMVLLIALVIDLLRKAL